MNKLNQLFKEIRYVEPSTNLADLILKKIQKKQARKVALSFLVTYAGFVFSLSAGIFSIVFFGKNFIHSQFWSLASLFFSDMLIVISYWQEYLFSLLETFPTAHAIAILIPIFVLFLSFNCYFSLKKRININSWTLFREAFVLK